MSKNIWTLGVIVVFLLLAIATGIEVSQENFLGRMFGVYLYIVLAIVAWMEVRWGALLVVAFGLGLFAIQLVWASWSGFPTITTAFALLNLIIPILGYLSYRAIGQES